MAGLLLLKRVTEQMFDKTFYLWCPVMNGESFRAVGHLLLTFFMGPLITSLPGAIPYNCFLNKRLKTSTIC